MLADHICRLVFILLLAGGFVVCSGTNCGCPPASLLSTVSCHATKKNFTADYACLPSAHPVSGDKTLVCSGSSKWTGTPLVCQDGNPEKTTSCPSASSGVVVVIVLFVLALVASVAVSTYLYWQLRAERVSNSTKGPAAQGQPRGDAQEHGYQNHARFVESTQGKLQGQGQDRESDHDSELYLNHDIVDDGDTGDADSMAYEDCGPEGPTVCDYKPRDEPGKSCNTLPYMTDKSMTTKQRSVTLDRYSVGAQLQVVTPSRDRARSTGAIRSCTDLQSGYFEITGPTAPPLPAASADGRPSFADRDSGFGATQQAAAQEDEPTYVNRAMV
eukprot:scpid46712/ scgid0194/ 